MKIELSLENTDKYIPRHAEYVERAAQCLKMLMQKSGEGSEFTGWTDIFAADRSDEINRIKQAAQKIRSQSQALVVIGIGGSYLGARAAADFIKSPDYNNLEKDHPDIYFAGNGLSSDAIDRIERQIGDRDFCVNVISKSGTTTEPAIAFRIFREKLEKKYGARGAADRIIATTDRAHGALKDMADKYGYQTFVIPDDVGGRYSVLTPVGLLPMAACGIDIDAVLAGAYEQFKICATAQDGNPALEYAAARNELYNGGKKVEVLSVFEPRTRYLGEWWKQLFGESEGKQLKGILPYLAEYTADLHSMGQYFQQGERMLFETFLKVERPQKSVIIPRAEDDRDNLNYLAGKSVSYVNGIALEATEKAHLAGGMPNMRVTVPCACEQSFGALVVFFEMACAVSAYMLGVNPFNQTGVENYKNNMFELLGKPTAVKV